MTKSEEGTPDLSRGERVQVECPDCDRWVVLAPIEWAKVMVQHAMDTTYPELRTDALALRVFGATCECGTQITLTLSRTARVGARA